jgi:neutral ceramidase
VRRALRPTDTVFGPEGPADDRVHVLAFLDAAGHPLAAVVNATAHPVYEMCIKQLSPDYPGETCRILEAHHPGTRAIFLQGAAGNINSPGVSTSAADAIQHAEKLSGVVDRLLGQLRPVPGAELVLRWRQVDLPARDLKGNPQAEPLRAELGALRLGEAALVFLPGEPFVEIGLSIGAASRFAFTAVVGYAEAYIGYIPTDRAFENRGYETGPGRWSRCARNAEAALRDAAIELVNSLR